MPRFDARKQAKYELGYDRFFLARKNCLKAFLQALPF
jgi:hypothetical protein